VRDYAALPAVSVRCCTHRRSTGVDLGVGAKGAQRKSMLATNAASRSKQVAALLTVIWNYCTARSKSDIDPSLTS
jgi:hypothetical protein